MARAKPAPIQCSNCDRTLADGEEVVRIINGQIVNGEFRQTEEDRVEHYECPDPD